MKIHSFISTEKAHSANVQHFVFMIAFHFENIDYNGLCRKFKDFILIFTDLTDLPTSGNQKLYSVIPKTVFSPPKLYFIIKCIF